jgi:hypothetical protein
VTGDRVDAFVAFSEAVTGFPAVRLHGTGQAEEYRATVADVAGADVLDALLDGWTRVREEADRGGDLDDLLNREVFGDPRLGPIARNVIKLWYVGIWYELPKEWSDAYGVRERDTMFTVSPIAYTEGLVWPAMGANPPGAKAPGYASWTGPPQIDDD